MKMKKGKDIILYALVAAALLAAVCAAVRSHRASKDIDKVVASIGRRLPVTTHYSYLDMILEDVRICGDTLLYRYVVVPMDPSVPDLLSSDRLRTALEEGMEAAFLSDYRTTDVIKLLHSKQMVYRNVFGTEEGEPLFDIVVPPSTYNPWVAGLSRGK